MPVLLDQPHPAPLAVHAVYPPGPRIPSKVRSFVDFLHEGWSSGAPWERGLKL